MHLHNSPLQNKIIDIKTFLQSLHQAS